jgi:uncharacterized protein YbjT (DUF2867 family)
MKVVVIGGTGLIGSKVMTKLREHGHEAVSASPNSGVNTLTGEGLAEVLQGASVVIDVSNSPQWEDAAVLNFFTTSTRNLLKYSADAGVKHLVALSIVGTDKLSASGYFRAKIAQEKLISEGSLPYTIVRATQFFEFLAALANFCFDGKTVRLSPALFQPMSAGDVATAVARAAAGAPANGIVETAGPEKFHLDEVVRGRMAEVGDTRPVVTDPNGPYAGAQIDDTTLVPGKSARLGETTLKVWLTTPVALTQNKPAQNTAPGAAKVAS